MPTNRQRRLRVRHDIRMPGWARCLIETGEAPDQGSEDSSAFFGWLFLEEPVPGLPEADSAAGKQLLSRAR
jgi:hypothetical protein